jgi:hypothetical protein
MTSAPNQPGPAPTADLIASLAAWHWIAGTPAGPVAFLLLARTPSSRLGPPNEALSRMHGLAASLRLASCSRRLPDIGSRLYVRDFDAFLKLDRCERLLHAPIGEVWSDFARGGGTVAVSVGLDPLRAHASMKVVQVYMAAMARAGRLFMGKTSLTAVNGIDGSRSAAVVEELR